MVQVVGVFDTTGSLGIPDMTWTKWNLKFLEKVVGIPQPGFHNVALSPCKNPQIPSTVVKANTQTDIRHAFHALAVDERRRPFSPTLWQFPADEELRLKKPAKTHDQLIQEWWNITPSTPIEQVKAAWRSLIDCEMYEELKGTDSELLQVWFPGVHINIGGGSDDHLKDWKGDFERE